MYYVMQYLPKVLIIAILGGGIWYYLNEYHWPKKEEEKKQRGSRMGKLPNEPRDFAVAHSKPVKDCFSGTESVCSERDFERRHRMSRASFNRIWKKLEGQDPFVQKRDCVGKLGIHPLCRFAACLRCVAHGDAHDREDESTCISESALSQSVKAFYKIMIQEFPECLNGCPTKDELDAILCWRIYVGLGFTPHHLLGLMIDAPR